MDKKVAILIATYNGEKYVKEQLESILKQDFQGQIDLYINDDMSSDFTYEIINSFSTHYPRGFVKLTQVKQGGHFENFRYLIHTVPQTYDFYFFCDQDDIWYEDKISNAVNAISANDEYTTYASEVVLVDAIGSHVQSKRLSGLEYNDKTTDVFLVNFTHGCTVAIKGDFFKEVVKDFPKNNDIVKFHDFWIGWYTHFFW